VGFAYSPDWGGWLTGGPGKTSIRGGFGIYYDRSETEQANQVTGIPPFSISTTLGKTTPSSQVFGGINPSFANPFQDIANSAATAANLYPFGGPASNVSFGPGSGNQPAFGGGCCAVLDTGTKDPMAENFNLTIERQIASSLLVSVGYVGSVAHHLSVGLPVNLATGLDSMGNVLSQYDATVYGPIDTIFSIGNSHYHSLQVTANKRLSHGLQFLGSYTYSHSIDNASGFENSSFGNCGGNCGGFSSLRAANPYCFPTCDNASSIYDARQRLVVSFFYQIPGLHGNALISRATSGWTVSGIAIFQAGFPLDVVDQGGTPSGGCLGPADFACWDAPNQVGPIHYTNPRTTGNWFDNTAFAVVPCENATGGCSGTGVSPASVAAYGNAPRNVLRGPGINNWDFQLYKDTQLTESTRVELRIEFYNLFNHVQFDPGGVITDIGAASGNFGAVTKALPPRRIQLAAKFYF
jgi:hypothetical protein